ncbi:HAD-IA family hydrolase [Kribbella sp. NPDC051770]|uniref:HAD family hydrolase n=1 Tax=Kribbella sp. NPDC051770 TaxID=3155413 RepID=UPI00344176D2
MTVEDLSHVLSAAKVVLFDFDGPICSVFDGYPAPRITEELRQLAGIVRDDLVDALAKASSPHDLLLATADDQVLARRIEEALQDAEMRAVESALPTPGAADCLAACRRTARKAAIVSNNYAGSVRSYLARAGLADLIMHVEGRDPGNPNLMKPSPHLIEKAAQALDVAAADCVFIGDQTSDMEAGRAAGARTVGYANKPGKADALAAAGADVIVETMTELATSIR